MEEDLTMTMVVFRSSVWDSKGRLRQMSKLRLLMCLPPIAMALNFGFSLRNGEERKFLLFFFYFFFTFDFLFESPSQCESTSSQHRKTKQRQSVVVLNPPVIISSVVSVGLYSTRPRP